MVQASVHHAFTSPVADATGTITIWDGATTKSVIASQVVRPTNWNSGHVVSITAIDGIAASNTTYTSGTIVLSGGANVTVGTNGQTVTMSARDQSVQTQNMVAISASDALFSSGTVLLSGQGAAVVNTAAGSIRISVPNQSVQPETQTFVAGIRNSETTYTSGTVNLSVVGGPLTIRSTTGQAFQFSADPTQTGISGIANSQTTYTSGTVSMSELGAITIRSTTGNQYQFSVNSQSVQTQGITGDQLSIGVSTGGNTAGNTTVQTGNRMVFVGTDNISLSMATGAGSTTISIRDMFSTATTVSSVATANAVGANASRFAMEGHQHEGVYAAGVSNVGNTSGNTTVQAGRVVLAGGNNITLSVGTAANGLQTITISGAAAGGAQTAISGLANSETTYTSGSVTLSALGAITIRSTTGQHFQFSVNSQTVQTQNMVVLYDGANSISSGTARFTNANGVSWSFNGQTVSASIDRSLSMYATSNTTQSSSGTQAASSLIFAGAGVASVGVTNGSVVLSVPSGGGGGDGGVFAGVSTMGNTAGSTGTVSTGNVVFVGSGDITLSQSTGAAGSAATVTLMHTYLSSYDAYFLQMHRVTATWEQATLRMRPWPVPLGYVHDRVVFPVHYSQATNSTLTVTISAWFGLYTRNASTLSLASSTSGTFSINGSGTASSAQNSGVRALTYGWTNTVPAGEYWLGNVVRSTTAGADATLSKMELSIMNSNYSGIMGDSQVASAQLYLGLGTYSATTSAMPNSVAFSQLSGSGSLAHRPPPVWFLSATA